MLGEWVGKTDEAGFERKLKLYEEEFAKYEQSRAENERRKRKYEDALAEYQHMVNAYEKDLAAHSDITRRAKNAAEQLKRNLTAVDWMAHPEQDRQGLADIAEVLDRGRTVHPAPEDLPTLRVPEVRSPTGVAGSAVPALIAAWTTSQTA